MKNTFKLSSISCGILLATALSGFSPDTTYKREAGSTQIQNSAPDRVNKASCVVGMEIRNQLDERLGKVKDVVMDLQSGRIAYIVMSTGRFRHKYLAVPPSAFSFSSDEKRLILNADRDKVASAAGFSKKDWPNMATPSWGAQPFWQGPNGSPYENRNEEKIPDLNKDPSSAPKDLKPAPLEPTPTPTAPGEPK